MNPAAEQDLRYPVGEFRPVPAPLPSGERRQFIATLAELPARLRTATAELSASQLDTPYRPGGWTVRQLVHHIADSHMNSYIRFKLALTEDEPVIKPYDEKAWAVLPDAALEIGPSLTLIESLHLRWVGMLDALGGEQWARRFRHPERGPMDLDQTLALYAWHSRHHLAHITNLRARLHW